MQIKSYELINSQYKIICDNGEEFYVSKKEFENTLIYACMELNKAKDNLFMALSETKVGKFIIKILNKLIKKDLKK